MAKIKSIASLNYIFELFLCWNHTYVPGQPPPPPHRAPLSPLRKHSPHKICLLKQSPTPRTTRLGTGTQLPEQHGLSLQHCQVLQFVHEPQKSKCRVMNPPSLGVQPFLQPLYAPMLDLCT